MRFIHASLCCVVQWNIIRININHFQANWQCSSQNGWAILTIIWYNNPGQTRTESEWKQLAVGISIETHLCAGPKCCAHVKLYPIVFSCFLICHLLIPPTLSLVSNDRNSNCPNWNRLVLNTGIFYALSLNTNLPAVKGRSQTIFSWEIWIFSFTAPNI